MTKKAWKAEATAPAKRRVFTDEFRREAVQMMLDGHKAVSVADGMVAMVRGERPMALRNPEIYAST